MPAFPRPTQVAHDWVSLHVQAGDTVVDATVGNGHDTRLLAELVGREGQVVGFDLQSRAIASTAAALADHPQVTLHCMSHERMPGVVSGPVAAVMFNLGYLPASDKEIITRPESTLPALDAACTLLKTGGLLTIVVYPGHEGGDREAAAVDAWVDALPGDEWLVASYRIRHARRPSPYLYGVQRISPHAGGTA